MPRLPHSYPIQVTTMLLLGRCAGVLVTPLEVELGTGMPRYLYRYIYIVGKSIDLGRVFLFGVLPSVYRYVMVYLA